MIVVGQPFSKTAPFHLLFDSLMLESISHAFSPEPIYYLTDRVNGQRMKNYLSRIPFNLKIMEAGVPEQGARRIHLYVRLFINLLSCRWKAEQLKARALIYLAFENITCFLHNIIRQTDLQEYYIVHNNFHRAMRRKGEWFIFQSISRKAKNLIFLEESIAEVFSNYCLSKTSNIRVIPHPVKLKEGEFLGCLRRKPEVVFAGRLTREKGIQKIIEAAKILKTETPQLLEKIKIKVVGPYLSGPNPKNYLNYVEYLNKDLTDAELEAVLEASYFHIVPYQRESYAYVTPGSVYRALGCRTPIIASDLPCLSSLLKGPRPAGYVFAGTQGLAEIIKHIAYMEPKEYDSLLDNVAWIISQRSPKGLAIKFRELLNL